MKTIEYDWAGNNELSDFVEGTKILSLGVLDQYIDAITPYLDKGKLVMRLFSEQEPAIFGPTEHEVIEHIYSLTLDKSGEKVKINEHIMERIYTQSKSKDYQEKFTRLRDLQRGLNQNSDKGGNL